MPIFDFISTHKYVPLGANVRGMRCASVLLRLDEVQRLVADVVVGKASRVQEYLGDLRHTLKSKPEGTDMDMPQEKQHNTLVREGDEFNRDPMYYCAVCGVAHTRDYKVCDGLRKPLVSTVIGDSFKKASAEGQQAKQPQLQTLSQLLDQRGNRYGTFKGHAEITQQLKDVIGLGLKARNKQLAPDQLEALDMICHKIGRIVNGDPDYDDSWVDIAGYAQLVADRLQGKVR